MKVSLLFLLSLLASLASIADTPQTLSPSFAEVQSVRLEVEQSLHQNELQVRVRDYSAANHQKADVTCLIYYVSEEGKESKVADLILRHSSNDLYAGVFPAGKDFVHGTVAKVIYQSHALRLPLSTWCMFSFH